MFFIRYPITFVEPCEVIRPRASLHILCQHERGNVVFTSPTSGGGPFLRVLSSSVLNITNCLFRGAGIEYASYGGTLALQYCVFDGIGAQLPLIVLGGADVTIEDTIIVRGLASSVWMGGGCLSIRGVRGHVSLTNVSVQNCTSNRDGGCYLITRNNATGMMEDDWLLLTEYGGTLHIRNSSFQRCKARTTSGGLVAAKFMTSVTIENVVLRHGVGTRYAGCMDLYNNGPGDVVLRNIRAENCTSLEYAVGCINVFSNVSLHTYVSNVKMVGCTAKQGVGCINVDGNFTGMVDMQNVSCIRARVQQGSCGCYNVLRQTNAWIENCVCSDSYVDANGGGMCIIEIPRGVLQTLVFDNVTARKKVGAVQVVNSSNITIENLRITKSVAFGSGSRCFELEGSDVFFRSVRMDCSNGVRTTRHVLMQQKHNNGVYLKTRGDETLNEYSLPLFTFTRTFGATSPVQKQHQGVLQSGEVSKTYHGVSNTAVAISILCSSAESTVSVLTTNDVLRMKCRGDGGSGSGEGEEDTEWIRWLSLAILFGRGGDAAGYVILTACGVGLLYLIHGLIAYICKCSIKYHHLNVMFPKVSNTYLIAMILPALQSAVKPTSTTTISKQVLAYFCIGAMFIALVLIHSYTILKLRPHYLAADTLSFIHKTW
eukprot:PhF_6_TR23266/c1_g1_i3/m.32721